MEAAILLGILSIIGLSASLFGDLDDNANDDNAENVDDLSAIEAEELTDAGVEFTSMDDIGDLAADNADDLGEDDPFVFLDENAENWVEDVPESEAEDPAEDVPETNSDEAPSDISIVNNGSIGTSSFPIYPTPADRIVELEDDTGIPSEDFTSIPSADDTGILANEGTSFAGVGIGGPGNDSFYGSEGNDSIASGDGADTLFGQAGSDTLNGGAGNDQIYGAWDGKHYEIIEPQDFDDPDLLMGGDGDDAIHMGSGDVVMGEGGKDIFYTGTWVDPANAPVVLDLEMDEILIVSVPPGALQSTSITIEVDPVSGESIVQANLQTVAIVSAGGDEVTLDQISVVENSSFAKF